MAFAPGTRKTGLSSYLSFWSQRRRPTPTDEVCTRDRRTFVLEVLESAPGACGSEADVCQMMYVFPARF